MNPQTKKKKEKSQIDKIRNERRDITINATEIKRTIRNYYEQLYANKLDYPEDMDKFLETYNIPRLRNEEIKSLNKLVTGMEIESVIKNFPTSLVSLVNSTKLFFFFYSINSFYLFIFISLLEYNCFTTLC